MNLNVHYHLVVPDGVFVDDGEGLRFVMHPVPTSADVLAILDRIQGERNEGVLFHRASRTLYMSDLFFNLHRA